MSRKHDWFDDYILYTALSNGSGDWGCLIFLLEFAVGSFVLLAALINNLLVLLETEDNSLFHGCYLSLLEAALVREGQLLAD
ncbi:MAG: hypothetical protein SOV54_00180 [Faecalibacterium prausnitzii]|nr:hypothetical protein [Faecalibacterium prausnitzii]